MSTDAAPTTDAPTTDALSPEQADLTAADIAWDLDTLIEGTDIDALMDRSDELTEQIAAYRGRVAELDAAGMAAAMQLHGRAAGGPGPRRLLRHAALLGEHRGPRAWRAR